MKFENPPKAPIENIEIVDFDIKVKAVTTTTWIEAGEKYPGRKTPYNTRRKYTYPRLMLDATIRFRSKICLIPDVVLFDSGQQFVTVAKKGNMVTAKNISPLHHEFSIKRGHSLVIINSLQQEV